MGEIRHLPVEVVVVKGSDVAIARDRTHIWGDMLRELIRCHELAVVEIVVREWTLDGSAIWCARKDLMTLILVALVVLSSLQVTRETVHVSILLRSVTLTTGELVVHLRMAL